MTVPSSPHVETLADFLTDRLEGWGEVRTVQNAGGWHDIVLRIDGSYSSQEEAEDIAAWFRGRIAELHARDRREGGGR